MRFLDRIVTSGIIFLLVGSPLILQLPEGRKLHIFGTAAFALFFLWMVKILAGLTSGSDGAAIPIALKSLVLPLSVLIGLLAFQVVPLPPNVLRVISSPTYHLYQKCLSGWPTKLDYDLQGTANAGLETNSKPVKDDRGLRPIYPLSRTLSIAPSFTKTSLLSGAAYLAFFLVAAFYPFSAGNAWVTPKLIAAMLFSGVLVASLGLLDPAYWNAKYCGYSFPRLGRNEA